MPVDTCCSSLPTTAQYQITHLTPASVNSLLTQQVPDHAAPATGHGQVEMLLCGLNDFHPSSPSPQCHPRVQWLQSFSVYSLCYCGASTMAFSIHAHPHSSAARLISHWIVQLLTLHGATQWQQLRRSSIKLLTSSTTSHGIGIHTLYRCRSEVSVSEVSVQSGIGLSLSITLAGCLTIILWSNNIRC